MRTKLFLNDTTRMSYPIYLVPKLQMNPYFCSYRFHQLFHLEVVPKLCLIQTIKIELKQIKQLGENKSL